MEEASDGTDAQQQHGAGGVDDMLKELFPDLDPAMVRRVLGLDPAPELDEEEQP